MILGQNIRVGAQDFRYMQHQIAKIAGVELYQALLIGRVNGAGMAVGKICVFRRGYARGCQAPVLPALDYAQ